MTRYRLGLCAFLLSGVLIPGLALAQPSFTVVTASASPDPVTRGTSVTIATSIQNTGSAASGILIDVGVWNAGGVRVSQQVTTGQSFQAGEQKSFQWSWAVPATQATGGHAVSVGVFDANWSSLYVWVDQATTLTVQAGGGGTFTLTVSGAGTGSGTVTSAPAGIGCGTDCTEAYASGTAVTLTAAAAAGSVFGGWSGACSGAGTCAVTLSAARSVTATFNPASGGTFTLTVSRAGTGTGTVTSAPAGIGCGTDCTEAYASGTAVTLTAAAAAGSVFGGWSGACSGAGTCAVTLSAARSVTATFNPVSAAPGFTVETTSASPDPVTRGTSTTITSAIVDTGGAVSGILIDVGIWNASGTRVSQLLTTGQTFQAGERRSLSSTWAVPSGQATGAYRVSVGVFAADWSQLYTWVDSAATLAVQSTPTFTLTVSRGGTGSGTVTSAPAGISCGTDCTETYASGTAVTLTATPAAGSVFGGWSGGCTGSGACALSLAGNTTVTASFTAVATLTVATAGSGTGAVSSAPAGISCGADCTEAYPAGTAVTLTAAPAADSTFTGWSGGGCAGTGPCALTLAASTTVTAAFSGPPRLTVAKAGAGSGTVTSAPAGIDCGTGCATTFPTGTVVALTATPASGSTFTGWSGGCAGAGPCSVTLATTTTVGAAFAGPSTLTVTKSGTGSGTVTSAPAGIDCGADCSETYPGGTAVTLTATPAPGSTFAGWSGGGCGGTGACAVTLSASSSVTASFSPPETDNPVVVENRRSGSTGWQLGGWIADDWAKQIKGYASATSVGKGESLAFHVTVNPAQSFTIDVYRIGWYGGLGGRLMLHVGPLAGVTQGSCPRNSSTGLIACAWSPGYTLTVPDTWTSGVYLAVLTNADGAQNYVVFVVRDGRPAPLLYQLAVTTYQAYNNYPDDGSAGKSLYDFNSYGPSTLTGDRRAVKVSFDRPYSQRGAGQLLHWEIHFIRWLERSGYDVTYSTDLDTHTNGAGLRSHRAFLSVGHDEYWSREMFDAVEAARDAGVSLGFFGADAVYWQVRFEPSAAGVPARIMVCYKDAGLDPVPGAASTVRFRDPPVNRPEQTLVGIMYTAEVTWDNLVPYVVPDSSHPIFAGTGFQSGDSVPGIVGYEMDRQIPEYPLPPHTSYTLLSASPAVDVDGHPAQAQSSLYQAPGGAWVFAAGTISWSWGLDDFDRGLADARIQRMTGNILGLFGAAP